LFSGLVEAAVNRQKAERLVEVDAVPVAVVAAEAALETEPVPGEAESKPASVTAIA
jgi:hypothetical protein